MAYPKFLRHSLVVVSAFFFVVVSKSAQAVTPQISTGPDANSHGTMALKSNGDLWFWACYSYLFPMSLTPGRACTPPTLVGTGYVAASGMVAIRADGTVWEIAGSANTGYSVVQIDTTMLTGAPVAVASSSSQHHAILTSDGNIWTWGINSFGQLGTGDTESRGMPFRLGDGATAIAAGYGFTLALSRNGELFAWGRNNGGELGIGSTTNALVPTLVGEGFIAVAAGRSHAVAIKRDSSVWTWGNNRSGQLGDGTINDSTRPIQVATGGFVAVAAGEDHTVALKTDGNVWTWGSNDRGQLGNRSQVMATVYVPTQIGDGAASIAAGGENTFALSLDGKLLGWGDNTYWQLGIDSNGDLRTTSSTSGYGQRTPTPTVIMDSGFLDADTSLSTAQADCLFNWAETNYPSYFGGSPQRSTAPPYYYRYYPQQNAYLAATMTLLGSPDSHLYYLGPLTGNNVTDLGRGFDWGRGAGCR